MSNLYVVVGINLPIVFAILIGLIFILYVTRSYCDVNQC